jgi:diadenosine tetraphosphate (Ap4A) HIT family hydrolase
MRDQVRLVMNVDPNNGGVVVMMIHTHLRPSEGTSVNLEVLEQALQEYQQEQAASLRTWSQGLSAIRNNRIAYRDYQ